VGGIWAFCEEALETIRETGKDSGILVDELVDQWRYGYVDGAFAVDTGTT
jgi:hypothetical protein